MCVFFVLYVFVLYFFVRRDFGKYLLYLFKYFFGIFVVRLNVDGKFDNSIFFSVCWMEVILELLIFIMLVNEFVLKL